MPTKPVSTQLDLALVYSPGVAEPRKRVALNPDDVHKYTAKGNLVAVISNGTAVLGLGLGNIGPAASKPVMEGKGVLFKKFADIDVFDIEIDCQNPDDFIRIVKSLKPTFGGINLEDIKAPDPEISYQLAMSTRPDLIMATGRSGHPNQVKNVLGFPCIFRGALDVRATEINKAMKLVAVRALAELSREPVPDVVNKAYGDNMLSFGRTYLIPKLQDPRLITTISPAVARAAMESSVARRPIEDWTVYEN